MSLFPITIQSMTKTQFKWFKTQKAAKSTTISAYITFDSCCHIRGWLSNNLCYTCLNKLFAIAARLLLAIPAYHYFNCFKSSAMLLDARHHKYPLTPKIGFVGYRCDGMNSREKGNLLQSGQITMKWGNSKYTNQGLFLKLFKPLYIFRLCFISYYIVDFNTWDVTFSIF